MRRLLLLVLAFGLPTRSAAAVPTPAAFATDEAPRPNVVVIMVDDMGFADCGFTGCRDYTTPNIDRIASEGVVCRNGYAAHSFCSPSRAGILTGRYPQRFGHERNPRHKPNDASVGLPLSETLLPKLLALAGYRSMLVGKWHLGAHPQFHPLARGFDEFFGFVGGGHSYFPRKYAGELEGKRHYDTRLMRGREFVDEDAEYLTDALSREAVAFIERQTEPAGDAERSPFFLFLSYNAPHSPLQATPEYLDLVADIENKRRRTYAAMVKAVDAGVGRVLDTLADRGVADETLVVFLSDNGGPEAVNRSDNGPLRGGKGNTFEGGIRVPFALRWPAAIDGGREFVPAVSALDLTATILAAAGAGPAKDRPLDGVDLVPFLNADRPPERLLFWRQFDSGTYVVRRGGAADGSGHEKYHVPLPGRRILTDLTADIGETRNLAGERTATLKQLEDARRRWDAELIEPVFPGLRTPKSRAGVFEKLLNDGEGLEE